MAPDKKDEIINLQLDIIRKMTENNIMSLSYLDSAKIYIHILHRINIFYDFSEITHFLTSFFMLKFEMLCRRYSFYPLKCKGEPASVVLMHL